MYLVVFFSAYKVHKHFKKHHSRIEMKNIPWQTCTNQVEWFVFLFFKKKFLVDCVETHLNVSYSCGQNQYKGKINSNPSRHFVWNRIFFLSEGEVHIFKKLGSFWMFGAFDWLLSPSEVSKFKKKMFAQKAEKWIEKFCFCKYLTFIVYINSCSITNCNLHVCMLFYAS